MEAIAQPTISYATMNSSASEQKQDVIDTVMKCYMDDKLLIRTLYSNSGNNRFRVIENDLNEIIHAAGKKSCSSSYIPYQIPMQPYGRMGFLLDLEKCIPEGFYKHDAGVFKVDDENRRITWSNSKKSYVCDTQWDISVPKEKIQHKAGLPFARVKNICDIKCYMQKETKPAHHNEVVISFDKDAIIGIVAVLNCSSINGNASNEQILTDSETFRLMILEKLEIDIPIYTYDIISGELSVKT